ncbi:MAG: zinc-binding alcohol dehydrogenase [Verrucomicrobiota bacterium JB024]|nr:zinc-binding alcohol dehydrogenase [Verrucomicrobiota bacterium JB024]
MKQIFITAHRQAELLADVPAFEKPIGTANIRGRTIVSLVSPGTELNFAFLTNDGFPKGVGYACVQEVTEVGEAVVGFQPGDIIFSCGGHSEYHELPAAQCCKLPEGMKPEVAVFARLMGVSMTTLNTTTAHPPAKVLVTGLGPVGNLAAQIFSRCGYDVTASDPSEARCQMARQVGLPDVRTQLAAADDLKGKVCLHLECAGHERAVLDGCRLMRRKGECVMVGVPWSKRADLQAFDILHAVFHNYVTLRSGWEWEIPRQEEMYKLHSIIENYRAALKWLHEGSIKVDGLATSFSPADCQEAYSKLEDQSLETPTAIFDWRKLP